MKTIFLSLILLLAGFQIQAQKPAKKKKTEEITIHTSSTCGECKEIIESTLSKTKGVKKSNLDLATKDVTVVYSPKKTNPTAIKKVIVFAGYDADELKADQEAYDNLPKCCKVGGMED